MRKITTAITAAALAFSMLAAAVPAAAVTGYDSAYAGESAFVNITGGQTQNFQVFFANTGTTSWQRGTGTQVDLAACLEDKVTCNAQDASEATWNPSTGGWLSATRYTSTVQTVTPPGSLGTFSYNITAPTAIAAGIYRFNGDLVLAATGEKIHPEGYYQEANTGGSAGAPTITLLTPNNGPVGQDVVITGSGFVCNPTFPTVSFGGTNGTVLSCGASSITVDAPSHALGAVTVTVSNPGSGPSNGLTFAYTDVSGPSFQSMTVSGDTVTVTFSEPVCRLTGTADADWNIQNISSATGDLAIAGTTDNLPTDCTKAVSTYSIFLPTGTTVPNGAFVEATLLVQGNTTSVGVDDNENIVDASANEAAAPQSRQATAVAPETTRPTFVSASGAVGQPNITLTFSEPVYCDSLAQPAPADFTVDDQSIATGDPTVTAVGNSNACGITRNTADTAFNIAISANLKPDVTYTVTINSGASTEIQDAVGNTLTVPTSVTFTSGAGDFTPPTLVDSRVANNLGTTDWGYNTLGGTELGDSFNTTFSEVMNGTASAAANVPSNIQVQDQDGTVLILTCGGTVTCLWNATVTTLIVTVAAGLSPTPATATGTTPGMQIPFNITSMNGFQDVQGNVPNVLGSADRLVDYE